MLQITRSFGSRSGACVGAPVGIALGVVVAVGGASTVVGAGTSPDLIVGSVSMIQKFGTVDGITAYSAGINSCNIGTANLAWEFETMHHPLIAQQMYRLHDGRFEMIGLSWCHHGLCALQQSLCGTCIPAGVGCPSALGVGCSNVSSASSTGLQMHLGPRSAVHGTTGEFALPWNVAAPAEPTIGRRLQVHSDDLDPSRHPGALYFVEVLHVHVDDAAAGAALNNASHRQVVVGAFNDGWNLTFNDLTVVGLPAIHAWQQHDPEVHLATVDVDADGRFIAASRAHDNGDGTWSYEYAVMNFNSDRSARSFTVGVPRGAVVTSTGQTIVNHHSGEPYSTDPWTIAVTDDSVTWTTSAHADDENANALRWGTMFSFRLVTDAPPRMGSAQIGLFKPGSAPDPFIDAVVPSSATIVGDLNGDGVVDGADLGILLANWGPANGGGAAVGDLNGDDVVDGADLGILLANWSG